MTNYQQQEIDNQHLCFITWTPWFIASAALLSSCSMSAPLFAMLHEQPEAFQRGNNNSCSPSPTNDKSSLMGN
jgi:hypothetical protein